MIWVVFTLHNSESLYVDVGMLGTSANDLRGKQKPAITLLD